MSEAKNLSETIKRVIKEAKEHFAIENMDPDRFDLAIYIDERLKRKYDMHYSFEILDKLIDKFENEVIACFGDKMTRMIKKADPFDYIPGPGETQAIPDVPVEADDESNDVDDVGDRIENCRQHIKEILKHPVTSETDLEITEIEDEIEEFQRKRREPKEKKTEAESLLETQQDIEPFPGSQGMYLKDREGDTKYQCSRLSKDMIKRSMQGKPKFDLWYIVSRKDGAFFKISSLNPYFEEVDHEWKYWLKDPDTNVLYLESESSLVHIKDDGRYYMVLDENRIIKESESKEDLDKLRDGYSAEDQQRFKVHKFSSLELLTNVEMAEWAVMQSLRQTQKPIKMDEALETLERITGFSEMKLQSIIHGLVSDKKLKITEDDCIDFPKETKTVENKNEEFKFE